MDGSTFLILLLIGLFAGIASGFVGIGGGIIIIPCLIYFLKLDQYQAQGVSLALMLPPIGILAFYSYYPDWPYFKSPHLLCHSHGIIFCDWWLDRI
jgi:uncharacterized membrane protein YfcA